MTPANPSAATGFLLDIEGTTTPLDFVYRVLFPFARERVASYLSEHLSDANVEEDLAALRSQHSEDAEAGLNPPQLSESAESRDPTQLVTYIRWLMDADRKVTALKSLQGRIWEEGYRNGELRSQVFDDVPPAFRRWVSQKKTVAIYSSGSVLAQKLLFANTGEGDLTRFISSYFDTNTGSKTDRQSYSRIAEAMRLKPYEILFISDMVVELSAASLAGMDTALCLRPGNRPQDECNWTTIHSFDEL